jgi:NAD+ diphosphatase
MIQDIHPNIFYNEYAEKNPTEDDFILFFSGQNVLINTNNGDLQYPQYRNLKMVEATYTYLFKIDEMEFFLAEIEMDIEIDGFSFENISIFRNSMPKYNAFAGTTAYHINCWYSDNKFCGRCGDNLVHHSTTRMMLCEKCKNNIYPKISAVVIVAISDGDKLLLTKYAGREYKNHALVAGFIEIGESPEEAVHREVMEEVGLNVKNLTYYKSQPWGFSESLLIGYFAELNGDSKITLDEDELSEAVWIKRDEIEIEGDGLSLTNEMILKFKNNA